MTNGSLGEADLERRIKTALYQGVGDARPPADGWDDLRSRIAQQQQRRRIAPRMLLLAAALVLALAAGVFAGSRFFPEYVSPRPEGVNIGELSFDAYPPGPLRVTVELAVKDSDRFVAAVEGDAAVANWGFQEGLGFPAQWPFVWEGTLSMPRAELRDTLKQLDEVATLESLATRPADDPSGPSVLVLRVRNLTSE